MEINRTNIDVYTDGSCIGNKTGCPGGWAAILVHPKKELVIRGKNPATTNNRMELTAVIEAVKVLRTPCNITVWTDSSYVMMDSARWIKWQAKGKFENKDLWFELLSVLKNGNHKIRYTKVAGHSGDDMNERCDKIAREQALLAKGVLK